MTVLDDFIVAADQLVIFKINYDDIALADQTVSSLEAYKIELNALWAEVKMRYSLCVQVASEENQSDKSIDSDTGKTGSDKKAVKSKYQSSSLTYINCLAEIIENHKKLAIIKGDIPSDNPSTSDPYSVSCIKVPPCDTETFTGNYLTWPSFRDMFTAVYINHPKLCPVQKLFHLRAKTKGDANNIVSKFPLTATNFELAWTALADQYENKRILVNNQLKSLFNLPSITHESSKLIKDIQREINDALSNLKTHKISTQSWDPILVYLCSNRLPETTLSLWEQSLKTHCEFPSWKDLDDFLTNRYRVLETISDIKYAAQPHPASSPKIGKYCQSNREKQPHKAFHLKANHLQCKLCKNSHPLRVCPKFTQMTTQERISTVVALKHCMNCLASTHLINDCRSVHTCMKCKQRHHTLLHTCPQNESTQPSSSSQQSHNQSIQSAKPVQIQTFFSRNNNRVLLATALVEVHHLGDKFTVRALVDPASEVTFITERTQRRLNLPVKPIQASISGMSEVVTATSSRICSFIIGSKLEKATIEVNAIVLKHLTGNLPTCKINPMKIDDLIDFDLADPFFYESSNVDLVIGADLYPTILKQGVKHNIFGSLLGQNTVFGWILSGPIQHKDINCFSTILSYYSEVSLDQQIAEFWKVEEVSEHKPLSLSEQYCEEHYAATTSRDVNGRYVIRLPFKQPTPVIGRSRDIALRQLNRMEASLARKPELKLQYDQVLQEYISLQHMEEVPSSEIVKNNQIHSFYLPHHAVVKPESSSTKVRVVFNASNPTSNGISLNDILHVGPVLQTDLMTLILRWRFYRFVFNADIEKMYRQVLVHPEHTLYQRVLFRKPGDSEILDFELKTVTFGVNCAPYLALKTLQRLADDVRTTLPLASSVLRRDFYVDDVLSGAHDLKTAIETQKQLIEALSSAGFCLRKWTANCSDLINKFPLSHLYDQDLLKFEDKSFTKTLGIQWNAKSDSFHFLVKFKDIDYQITKRAVLSVIARLFDPAGWLAPVIITAKIIMQQIWKDGTSWDQSLEPQTCNRWRTFFENLAEIESVQIPRWIQYKPDTHSIQIHGFCDASESAYAAALYIRIHEGPNCWISHLLCAKSKVAPVQRLSLPRIELCGALLISKLVKGILPQLGCKNYKLHLWTDSSIVLCLLEKPPSTWGTFVGNRVSLIQEITSNAKWMHVRSADNPADLATRGLTPLELKGNNLWWTGPSWLSQAESCWPRPLFPSPNETDLERRPIKAHHNMLLVPNIEDIIQRFSSFSRALRVISFVLRFFHRTHANFRSKFAYVSHELTREELLRSKNLILRLTQSLHFPIEYACLSKGEPIPNKCALINLNPLMDSDKMLRVNGRLVRSTLSFNERYPVILPYHAHITSLIVQFIHKLSLHGENQLLIRLVRCEYWIPKIKNLAKKLIRRCKICTIHRKKVRTQIMAALPPERTTISLPFNITGLDFAGPFTIKSFSGRNCRLSKGYVCLFICFSTKAIHLEPTSDLTSQSFLAALSRFIARRGMPKTIFSDNGTNLVGASKLIANDFKEFKRSLSQIVSGHYNDRNLEWKFIPPGAPHMGGLWEAGVKSFKTHFRKVAADYKFTYEEFSTLLAKVEACLNSRPISPISENCEDILPLTPGHFLCGGPLLAPPEANLSGSSLNCINKWKQLKILHHQFCRRWKNEYLLELQKRHKWKHPQQNIKEDELVVIRGENLPPNEWRLGRVIKVYPGIDNKVRVADIRTQQGIITRPIVKLCVLSPE